MDDLIRFGLVIVSVPVAVVGAGILLGLVGRWIAGHRGGRRRR